VTSSPSTPHRPKPRLWTGWPSSVTSGKTVIRRSVKLWNNAWTEFTPFLNFDPEIRTVICTTNAIESLGARFRRAIKARGHFPNEQAALKCLYLVIRSLTRPAKGRQRWTNRWKKALNAFDITFDGRLTTGRK
jgi:putative transposase